VEDNGYVLEQLTTSYPYKQLGGGWGTGLYPNPVLSRAIGGIRVILVLLIVWLLALRSPNNTNVVIWAMVAVLLTVLPAVMVWLIDVKSMAVDAFDASLI